MILMPMTIKTQRRSLKAKPETEGFGKGILRFFSQLYARAIDSRRLKTHLRSDGTTNSQPTPIWFDAFASRCSVALLKNPNIAWAQSFLFRASCFGCNSSIAYPKLWAHFYDQNYDSERQNGGRSTRSDSQRESFVRLGYRNPKSN